MLALDLDFRREDRFAKRAGIALLVAGLAGVMVAGTEYSQLSDELTQTQINLHQSGKDARKQSVSKHSSGELAQLALETKRANEVAFALKLPWNELFASVESANMANVALLSIESDTVKRQVKISGEAKDPESMLEYAHVLGTQPKLTNTYLQSHLVQEQDPQHPVRFVLGADWVSDK